VDDLVEQRQCQEKRSQFGKQRGNGRVGGQFRGKKKRTCRSLWNEGSTVGGFTNIFTGMTQKEGGKKQKGKKSVYSVQKKEREGPAFNSRNEPDLAPDEEVSFL